jgi:hypothetical protein
MRFVCCVYIRLVFSLHQSSTRHDGLTASRQCAAELGLAKLGHPTPKT